MRYDSLEHIDNLMNGNEYPKIHDDIFQLHKYVLVKNVLDVGCCYGLLSHRLSNIYDVVVGVEQNPKYAEHFLFKDNIHYFNFAIDGDNLGKLNTLIKKYNIQAVYCRRVIPELYDTGGMGLLYFFKKIMVQNEVQYIVIEGRFESKNSKHIFKSCNQEFEFFEDKYDLVKRHNNCGVLKLKSNPD